MFAPLSTCTEYLDIGDPPSLAGAVHETVADVGLCTDAVTAVGASGAVLTTGALGVAGTKDGFDCGPVNPAALVAETSKK
jgi:hypothetical protein